MIKRTVEVSSEGVFLHLHQKHLVIDCNGEEVSRVPCEDTGILVLDSPALLCTQDILAALADSGACVVVCGRDHNPKGLLWPLAANVLLTERLRMQVNAAEPLKKRLWQQLVQAKILGQLAALPDNSPFRARLKFLASEVRSGDPDNIEAQASKIYWRALFPATGFVREREGKPPNNLLNYGYMVFRASIVRAICAAGLHPSLGLHHHNKYNQFCLADDLLEPYRHYVDAQVKQMFATGITEVNKEAKKDLLSLLAQRVNIEGENRPMMIAFGRTVSSLVACYAGESKMLELPEP